MIKAIGCASAAVVVLGLAGSALAQDWPGPEWSHVQVGDWDLVSESDSGMLTLMKPARGAGVRAWSRAEFLQPTELDFQSMVSLIEFDCSQDRMRHIQSTFYGGTNMSGTSEMMGLGEWTYTAPGTIGAGQVDYACGRGRWSIAGN